METKCRGSPPAMAGLPILQAAIEVALDTVYNRTAEADHRGISLAAEDSAGKLVRGKLGRVEGHKSGKGGAGMNPYDFTVMSQRYPKTGV